MAPNSNPQACASSAPAAGVHLVSRHPGALAWLRRRVTAGSAIVHSHLDPQHLHLAPGDRVAGVLPVAWLERICRSGARAYVIDVELPAHLRGVELSADQLDGLGARLVEYRVVRVGSWEDPAGDEPCDP